MNTTPEPHEVGDEVHRNPEKFVYPSNPTFDEIFSGATEELMGFRDFNDPIRDLARAAEMYYDEGRYMAGADKEEFACEYVSDLAEPGKLKGCVLPEGHAMPHMFLHPKDESVPTATITEPEAAEAEKDDVEGEDLEYYAARAMSARQREDMKKLKDKAFIYAWAHEELRKEKLGHVEPAPTPTDGPSMHDLVIEDMAKRKSFGLAKYGTLLQAGNGRDALMDAYEEVLDLAVYLRQAIEERYPQRYVKGLDTEVSGDES